MGGVQLPWALSGNVGGVGSVGGVGGVGSVGGVGAVGGVGTVGGVAAMSQQPQLLHYPVQHFQVRH